MVILCGSIIMLPVLKQNLGDHKFKNKGEVVAVETVRLIMEYGIVKFLSGYNKCLTCGGA